MRYENKNAFDYENGFYLTSDVSRLGNILSHYELYKKIVHLPGDIVECGVFKGGSLIQFASFRELLENERSRKIIGFDAFGRFPSSPNDPDNSVINNDNDFIDNWNRLFSDEFLTKEDIYDSLKHKGISNVELVEGNIMETVEIFLHKCPATQIALLHIDVDVYHPTKKALDLLFPRIVRGGVVVFDDYGTIEGETMAVNEFMEDQKEYALQKFTFSQAKPSFFVKK